MAISSEKKGNQLFTFVHYLNEIIDKDIWETERYRDDPERFYYTILHKLRSLLDAGSLLLTNIDGKPHYIDTLYLSLRTCMLDVICLYYIMDGEENKEAQPLRIRAIMADHIRSFFQMAASDKEKEEIQATFTEYFENGKFRNDIEKITTKTMVDGIQVPEFKREAERCRNLYNIFSKLEHNGQLTFNILHSRYDEKNVAIDKKIIYEAIMLVMTCIISITLVWVDKDSPNYLQLISFYEKFLNNHL